MVPQRASAGTLAPLPATTLFGEMNMKLYRRWQGLQPDIDPQRHGTLPTALEYKDFQIWRARRRIQHLPQNSVDPNALLEDVPDEFWRESDIAAEATQKWVDEGGTVAQSCEHPLHPANVEDTVTHGSAEDDDDFDSMVLDNTVWACPLCTVRAHVRLLNDVFERWQELGGPWRLSYRQPNSAGAPYSDFVRAYHRVKLDMVNAVFDLAEMADAELVWETENPDADVAVARSSGATAALKFFWDQHVFPANLDASEHSNRRISAPDAPSTPASTARDGLLTPNLKKTVKFHPDTVEPQARSRALYARTCGFYDDLSPHACSDAEGWQDTSFQQDALYCISQSHILLLIYDPDAPNDIRYRSLNEPPNFGANEHIERLQQLVLRWMEDLPARQSQVARRQVASGSDVYFVHNAYWNETDDFDAWSSRPSLIGSVVEGWARRVGDISAEDDEMYGIGSAQSAAANASSPVPDMAVDEADDSESLSDTDDVLDIPMQNPRSDSGDEGADDEGDDDHRAGIDDDGVQDSPAQDTQDTAIIDVIVARSHWTDPMAWEDAAEIEDPESSAGQDESEADADQSSEDDGNEFEADEEGEHAKGAEGGTEEEQEDMLAELADEAGSDCGSEEDGLSEDQWFNASEEAAS